MANSPLKIALFKVGTYPYTNTVAGFAIADGYVYVENGNQQTDFL